MELKDVLLKRRSVRRFTDEPVTEAQLDALLHAAMAGPSACNRRPWVFYVVTDPEKVAQLRRATRFTNMEAPVSVVVCGDLERALPAQLAEFWVQDCSAATENLLLCAAGLGLGACWCGIYPQQQAVRNVSAILSLPEGHIPLNVIQLGHPAEAPEARDQYEEACVRRV